MKKFMNTIANKIITVKDATSIATRKPENKRALCDAAVQRFPAVNPVNTDSEGAIETVRIIGVSVLIGLNLKKM